MTSNGAILITGLPPHKGHLQLIRWASDFLDKNASLDVLVCGSPNDPLPLNLRVEAFRREIGEHNYKIYIHPLLHTLPDYPEQFDGTVEEFDRHWVDLIHKHVRLESKDILFASDTYGSRFAQSLGVNFVPYDPNREIMDISATEIRRDPFENFGLILPHVRRKLQKTVTIFGAESTGKTTMAKKMAKEYHSVFVPEWARPYLESLPTPETNDERMATIVNGQYASQHSVDYLDETPFIFQDTDLFSTYGYFPIYGSKDRELIDKSARLAVEKKSDLYIVMNSNIRFTPDQLRYGGNKRESDDQHWIDILKRFDCNYYCVKSINQRAQEDEVRYVLRDFFYKSNPVFGYERV